MSCCELITKTDVVHGIKNSRGETAGYQIIMMLFSGTLPLMSTLQPSVRCAMKKLLFLGLFLTFLSFSIRAGAQVHTSTPGPPSNITRPDSIQDSGVYGYSTNMSE